MGCINGYCSTGSNIVISNDKYHTSLIISNLLENKIYSDKTNNKYIFLNSSRQDNENFNHLAIRANGRHALSNKELNIPYNPLPFVKLKPKKSMYI